MDLTQEALVAAFAAIDRYDSERPFRVWISRIPINQCRDCARRRNVRAFFARALPIESARADASHSPLPDREFNGRSELGRVQAASPPPPQSLPGVLVLRGVKKDRQAEAG